MKFNFHLTLSDPVFFTYWESLNVAVEHLLVELTAVLIEPKEDVWSNIYNNTIVISRRSCLDRYHKLLSLTWRVVIVCTVYNCIYPICVGWSTSCLDFKSDAQHITHNFISVCRHTLLIQQTFTETTFNFCKLYQVCPTPPTHTHLSVFSRLLWAHRSLSPKFGSGLGGILFSFGLEPS